MALTLLAFFATRIDIKVYNIMKGPRHHKVGQASVAITKLSRDRSWFWSAFHRELFQAELKEGSFEDSGVSEILDSEKTVLAEFRKIEQPHFYLKVPRFQMFGADHDFRLQLLSAKALKCLIKNLATKFPSLENNFVEKSEIVKELEAVRRDDKSAFDAAAIRDCDLVVGHLVRACDDKLLEDYFLSYDVILNMTDQYHSAFTLMAWALVLAVAISATFYNLGMLLAVSYQKVVLKLSSNFCDQLRLFGIGGSPAEQLQTLDNLL